MRPLFIVGGGPSLESFDFSRLRDERVWAINTAIVDVPWAELLYWADEPCFTRNRELFLGFPGRKLTARYNPEKGVNHYPPEVEVFKYTGMKGFEEAPGCLKTGNNSGYALLQYAIRELEPLIALLGFDMHGKGGRSNYHDRNVRVVRDEDYEKQMIPQFVDLVAPALARNVSIYNLNPASRLDCFFKMSFDEFMRARVL